MAVLRLETFIPLPPAAEDEGLVGPEEIAATREAAYAEGVKAGAAAATAAFDAEKARLLSPILEALQDTILTRAEARSGALNGLRPLIETLSGTVLPPLAFSGLIAELRDLLASAAEEAPDDVLTLRLAPENVESIAQALVSAPAELSITADPALGPLEARVSWAGGFDAIDLGQVLNAAQALCARFFTTGDAQQQTDATTEPSQGDSHVG